MTPLEFGFIFDAYYQDKEEVLHSSWEQSRMLSYYIYCSYPKKGQNPSYTRFKQQHMPFYWDLGTTPLSPEEEFELEVSKENELTPSDWAARIAKLQGGKPIGATQIQSIK